MKSDIYDPLVADGMSVVVRRVAVGAVCLVLFAIFGVAAPYKIYKHFKSQQDAAGAATIHEEL